MTLIIRLTTDKTPEVFAIFEIDLKDGSKIKTCAVLERLEKVKAYYIYRGGAEDIRVYDVKDVAYDGSECTPGQPPDDGSVMVYSFKVDVEDPCKIRKYAKLIVEYKDGTKIEVCGEFAGIPVYYAEYRSCIDIDVDKIFRVRLVSMGFKPAE